MTSRRLHERVVIPSDVDIFVVFFHNDVPFLGNVVNFSLKGMQVALDEAISGLEPGTAFESMNLNTPDGMETLSQLRVQRVFKSNDGKQTRVAFEFDSVENMSRLHESLSGLQALHAEKKSQKQDWSKTARAKAIDEIPRIPGKGQYTEEARAQRLKWLREMTTVPLTAIAETILHPDDVVGNVENFVGAVQIPIGLAGPLKIKGQHADGNYIAPFATTEGALVASASRGARACSLSGGVTARVISQRMLRAPLFVFEDLHSAFLFIDFVKGSRHRLESEIAKVSRRAELMSIEPFNIGRIVHLRFYYQTGDAAGQNMTSIATWAACQWLIRKLRDAPEIKLTQFSIEGNMSGDKKANFQSLINGRGFQVTAEVVLTHEVIQQVFNTTAERMVSGQTGALVGAAQTGIIGHNINFANVIAAIFTATGQDIACVHESSIGQFFVEAHPKGIYAAVSLPALVIGTVGGGTRLPTQYECLEIMTCAGARKAAKLAEIIAAFCLALDLSTGAAIVADQFVDAHDRLGRNRPQAALFSLKELDTAFFERVLARPVKAAHPAGIDASDAILSDLAVRNQQQRKPVGIFPYRVKYADGSAERVIVKLKPKDRDILDVGAMMANMSGNEGLIRLYYQHKYQLDFCQSHVRELELYCLTAPKLAKFRPQAYHTWADESRDLYMIIMEDLSGSSHFHTVNTPEAWTPGLIMQVMTSLAELHSAFLGKTAELATKPWILSWHGERMRETTPFWRALLEQNNEWFPQLIDNALHRALQERLKRVVQDWQLVDRHPKTLVHNDCNPRNLCLRADQLCLYDWELACIHVPQRDVVEFLAYVMGEAPQHEDWLEYTECYRQALETQSGTAIDASLYREVLAIVLDNLLLNRLALTLQSHEFQPRPYVERVVRTAISLREFCC